MHEENMTLIEFCKALEDLIKIQGEKIKRLEKKI